MDHQSESEYADFVSTTWSTMVRTAVFLGASPSDAEDVAQTTLIRCYAQWDRVTAATNREGYVYRMLINCLRDQQRTSWWRRRSPTSLDQLPEPAQHDDSARIAQATVIHEALSVLPTAQREVVVLRYFVQLSEAQTAATLQIATGTVKSRLSRALARLSRDPQLADLTGDLS